MTAQERAQEIVSAILDACRIDAADKRPQLEALVMSQLIEIERQAAEKAVVLYREKTTEATDKRCRKRLSGLLRAGEALPAFHKAGVHNAPRAAPD
jgi:hypothetical protein